MGSSESESHTPEGTYDYGMESKLCCTVCSKLFTEPRLLPCLHVFCKSCLEPEQSSNATEGKLSCPTCYKTFPQNPAHLPRDFRVDKNSSTAAVMKDIQSGLLCGSCTSNKNAEAYCHNCVCGICSECIAAHKKFHIFKSHTILSITDHELTNKATSIPVKCESHKDEILRYYCITCSCLVCSECVLFSEHKEHVYNHLQEAMEIEKADLQPRLSTFEEIIPLLMKFMEDLDTVTKKISNKRDEIKGDIDRVFQEIISAIEKRRKYLIGEVDAMAVAKTTQLQLQKEEIERLTAGMQLTLQTGTQACSEYSSTEFLAVKSYIKDNSTTLIQELGSTEFHPLSDDCMNFTVDQQLVAKICEIGLIRDVSCYPSLCSLADINPKLPIGTCHGCNTSFVLQIRDFKGDDLKFGGARVEAVICNPSGETIQEGVVQDLEDGKYEIIIENESEGEYSMHVNVEGFSISGSPYDINVRDYTKIRTPLRAITTANNPACHFVDEEFLYVTFDDGSIFVYDRNETKTKVLQSGIENLRGITVDKLNGVIFLAGSNQITKTTLEGEVITSVGKHGSDALEFDLPLHLCQDKNGHLLVADYRNNRIQILNSDLSYIKSIACQSGVHGVAVDSNGNIHAASGTQVEVFSSAGVGIKQYGKSVLTNSGNIALINDKYSVVSEEDSSGLVFIFDWVNDIVINTIDSNLNHPFGVSVNQAGMIYISEYQGARILMY